MKTSTALLLWLLATLPSVSAPPPPALLPSQAERALRQAVEFFHTQVSYKGSYLWTYSEDLSKREGEGVATGTQGWVQPPGTPAVGMALLEAFDATGDPYYLDAARQTAQALILGQLHSGGWTYPIEFSPAGRKKYDYRLERNPKGRNTSTLDDNTTQTALRFLLAIDKALEFKDAAIDEAACVALDSVLKAQYPNGAWPQGYSQFPDPDKFPILKAAYPETWSKEYPGSQDYWFRYTLNDNLIPDLLVTLFEAERVCKAEGAATVLKDMAPRVRQAILRCGDFLLLAQMPEPQPAWAQQYDFQMHPAWARKFEPPSVTGGESQGAMRALMQIYRYSTDRKFLAPIPTALAYLKRSRLPDGRLARFYELRSNRPIYFTPELEFTYDSSRLRPGYAFTLEDQTDAIEWEYQALLKTPSPQTRPSGPSISSLERQVTKILAAQDSQGRWVETGGLRYHPGSDPAQRVIRSATFIQNAGTLSRYLAAVKKSR